MRERTGDWARWNSRTSIRGMAGRAADVALKFARSLPSIRVMACESPKHPENHSIWAEARALEASIRAIRRAQGKKNPEDFPPHSAECLAAMNEFVRDVCRVLEIDPDTLGDDDEDADEGDPRDPGTAG